MIPTKEQFIELNSALNSSVEFIKNRLDYDGHVYPPRERPDLSEIFTIGSKLPKFTTEEEHREFVNRELQQFIKPDVELYLEQSEASQNLPAWGWLHSQQNYMRAKGKVFKHWPSEERVGNGLEKHITKIAVDYLFTELRERGALISAGVTPDEEDAKTAEERIAARRINSSPQEILQSKLRGVASRVVRYKLWVAGVVLALSNYHYGETVEKAVNRKNTVDALVAAWETFYKQVELAQSDVELGEYLSIATLRLSDDRWLTELRALHQSGAIYFIERKDDTVLERLFIREIALLNRNLFYRPHTNLIVDLFYLDGMKAAPTERTIQRIVKSVITNRDELNAVSLKSREIRRRKQLSDT